MPTLPTQSFQTIVNNTAAGIQGRAAKLINFGKGSTLRAIVEGFAGLFLWFQAMVLQLLTACRLSTAAGNDVDTFVGDFGLTRLGAQKASGQVTFTRFSPAAATAFVPVGATVQSSDGSQNYAVTADATYPTYSASPAGYTLDSTLTDLIVPVEAVVAGAAGNVTAGEISVITSAITGIDTVVNVSDFTNGADFESDAALKKRFADFILGLSRGDEFGTAAAIEGIGVTVQWTYTEGYNLDGTVRPGYYFIVADDGSGNPSPDFLQQVTDAVYSVRPLGMQADVFPAEIIWATVEMELTTAKGYDHDAVVAQVAAAIATNIDSLGLGNPLPYSMLAGWAYAIPGVTKVSTVRLNGLPDGLIVTLPDEADLVTTKVTADGLNTINASTIKCKSAIVS